MVFMANSAHGFHENHENDSAKKKDKKMKKKKQRIQVKKFGLSSELQISSSSSDSGIFEVEFQPVMVEFLCLIALATIFRLCYSDVVFDESFKEPFGKRWNDGCEGVPGHAKSDLDERELGAGGGFVVLQFEIRLKKGLDCGGAYLKYFPPQVGERKHEEFDNSLYSIMFAFDECGLENKVHFVLKHKNPGCGEFVEDLLKSPPTIPLDKLSHVYIANNASVILIDGKQKKHANFTNRDGLEPPSLLPAKMIADPDDKKLEDWDEQVKIPVLEVVKPDDSETPKSNNPINESVLGRCGRGKFRKVRNAAHRAKCHSLPIDNDAWKAKEVPNPDYSGLKKPNFEPIVGIESKSCMAGDGIKKKIFDLSKLVDFLKMFKYDVKLNRRSHTTIISVSICYGQFCFFTWSYEI